MTEDEIKTMQAELEAEKGKSAAALKELEELKKKPAPAPDKKEEDPDLLDKVKKEKKESDAKRSDTKRVESSLKFTMNLDAFMKENEDVLPSDYKLIVDKAKREKYDSAVDQASDLKSALVQEFFKVQSNLDLLTSAQRESLDDFLKLTKNGKEEKADFVYGHLFEPALQTLRNVKKAEEIGKARSGHASSNKVEDEYKARLIQISRKTHLGEKGDK